MTDEPRPKRINWFWIILIAALAITFFFLIANPSGDRPASEPRADVDVVTPVEVPDTPVDDMSVPSDETMTTRIEDETAAEAATSEN